MTDYTHYFALVGEHWRGGRITDPTQVDPVGYHVDPLLGHVISLLAPPVGFPLEVGTTWTGGTSGAWGRVVRVLGTTAFVGESWTHPVYGQPSAALSPGETITFRKVDGTTATGIATLSQSGLNYPLYGQPALRVQDAELNSFIPTDKSDTPFWDRKAKYSRSVVLDHTTGAGGTGGSGVTNAADWKQGDRCTTSGGAAFFILLSAGSGTGGLDRALSIFSATGTLASGQTVTNTRSGATAHIGTLGAATTAGSWVPKHIVPNLNGTAFGWEVPPNGNGTNGGNAYVGQDHKLLLRAHDHFVQKTSVADRGVRVIGFDQRDVETTDGLIGGVTIQVVKCSGTFPTTWIAGETVTGGGGWSAKVHGYNATAKYLFVKSTNGAKLTSGTVTGGTSGATATSTGAAFGYRKGSTHFTALADEITAAQAATGALWMSSAAKFEGMFLSIWECEINTFHTSVGAAWPVFSDLTAAWGALMTELRELVGQEDMPIAIWRGDPRSRPDVAISGFNFAIYLQLVLDNIAKQVPGVKLVRTDTHEPAQTTGLPYTDTMVYHRPLDYLEDGENAWRVLAQPLIMPSTGNWRILPIVVTVASQSQQVGQISAATMMAIDKDPDLWPSATFPGVSTLDPNVLEFNCITEDWEVLDITQNATTFFGMSQATCGPSISLMQRMKGRFAADGEYSGLVGHINLAVSASSYNSLALPGVATYGAAATWDVVPSNFTVTGSFTVTVLPPTGMDPLARGRFTSTAGKFSNFQVNSPVTVDGSALGVQAMGGNDSPQHYGNTVYAVAPDGSYVDLVGTFVAETSTFSIAHGPLPITEEAAYMIRQAFKKATELELIPTIVLRVIEQGESDIGLSSAYKAKAQAIFDYFDQFMLRPKGATAPGTVIVQLSGSTPIGTDEEVTAIRTIQAELAAEMENAVVVDPTRLPMAISTPPIYPRTQRSHNGIHRTARGDIMCGFLIDAAAGTLVGIPEHPAGDAAVDFGTFDGGFGLVDGAASSSSSSSSSGGAGDTVTGAGSDFTGTESPVELALIVEDGTGKSDADSYMSLDEADTRSIARGNPTEWSSATTAQKQNWLRQAASAGIDIMFGAQWSGYRTSDTQSLDWPREGAGDNRSGTFLNNDVIPTAIKWCQFEFALSLALGVDPLENLNPANSVDRSRWATSTTDRVASLEESRTYGDGTPKFAVLPRLIAYASPFLLDTDAVGLA